MKNRDPISEMNWKKITPLAVAKLRRRK